MSTFRKWVLALVLVFGASAAFGQAGSSRPRNFSESVEPTVSPLQSPQNLGGKVMIGILTRSFEKGGVKENVIMIDPKALPIAQRALPALETYKTVIPRYIRTHIYGIALFQYPWGAPCFWLRAGSWIFTSNPTLGVADTAVAPGPSPCAGEGNVNYARVYYTWGSHSNLTTQPGMGPIDSFVGVWTAEGWSPLTFNFAIGVNSVHPIGETVEFKGFYQVPAVGFYGKWVSKLKPPTDDPGFDFTGDTVRESHFVRTNSCQDRARQALGNPSAGGIGIGKAATWTVGAYKLYGPDTYPAPQNYYGFDLVGWDSSAIQGYRCAGATQPPCGATLRQTMHHHAQSDDPDLFVAYQDNELGETMSGYVLPGTNPLKTSIGSISSTKNVTQFLPNAVTNLTASAFIAQRAKTNPDLLPFCSSK